VEARELYVAPSRLAARLAADDPRPLVLYDVGLGAGSNAASAFLASESLTPPRRRRLHIESFDRTESALCEALHHPDAFALSGPAGVAARDLLARGHHETPRTTWRLCLGQLPGALARAVAPADLFFWDPFSPKHNPDLWTAAAFAAARRHAAPRAQLFTYSSATAVRAALLLAGFYVGTGRPTANNRATTVAALALEDLEVPLDQRWLVRLSRSSAPFPPDAPDDALEVVRAHPQFTAAVRGTA
jgi:queuine tRNA-ribosyltransferase